MERIHVWNGVKDVPGGEERPAMFPEDIPSLQAAIEHHRAEFVIIDPLVAFLSPTVSANSDQDVRRVLSHLKNVAEATGVAFLVCRHLNKTSGSSAVYRGGGSIGIIGAARIGLMAAKLPDVEVPPGEPQPCVIAVVKSNIGPMPLSLGYHLATDEERGCGRVVWDGQSKLSAEDLVSSGSEKGGGGALQEAVEFVQESLERGPIPMKELEERADGAGINRHTFKKARRKLGVLSDKKCIPGTNKQHWVLSLPSSNAHK